MKSFCVEVFFREVFAVDRDFADTVEDIAPDMADCTAEVADIADCTAEVADIADCIVAVADIADRTVEVADVTC